MLTFILWWLLLIACWPLALLALLTMAHRVAAFVAVPSGRYHL